jgi:hypothetical protein
MLLTHGRLYAACHDDWAVQRNSVFVVMEVENFHNFGEKGVVGEFGLGSGSLVGVVGVCYCYD